MPAGPKIKETKSDSETSSYSDDDKAPVVANKISDKKEKEEKPREEVAPKTSVLKSRDSKVEKVEKLVKKDVSSSKAPAKANNDSYSESSSSSSEKPDKNSEEEKNELLVPVKKSVGSRKPNNQEVTKKEDTSEDDVKEVIPPKTQKASVKRESPKISKKYEEDKEQDKVKSSKHAKEVAMSTADKPKEKASKNKEKVRKSVAKNRNSSQEESLDRETHEVKEIKQSEVMALRKWVKKFDKTEEGQLLAKKTGYRVTVDKDNREVLMHCEGKHAYKFTNDKDYERVAKYLTYYIQMRMENQFKLLDKPIPFPSDRTDKEYEQAPIYVSPDWKTNKKRALILIQGTGAVRAGVWARSVCITDSLDHGSMLPQIKFAVENKMACLVLNPNFDKSDYKKDVDPRIDGMVKHCIYAFKKYIVNRSEADEVFIIAHSRGGKCLVELFKKYTQEFRERVVAVAFTDSVHKDFREELVDKEEEDWIREHCVHYVASLKPLGEKEDSKDNGMMPTYSAGHHKHEYTTGSSWPEIQKFFGEKSETELKMSEYSCYSTKAFKESKE